MPVIVNQKSLPYGINKLYDVITDVEKYPEFIPWFKKIKIISSDNNLIVTDVTIEFMFIRDHYRSTTELKAPTAVDGEIIAKAIVTMVDGPFNHFITIWSLKEINRENCLVEFKCDFSFNSKLYDKMASLCIKPMNRQIIDAFIKRVKTI